MYLNKLYVRASVVVPYGRYPRVPGPTISELVCSISLTSRYFQKLLISHQNLRRCAVCGVGGGCVRKANKQGRKQKKKSKTVENCSFKLKTALFILSHNNNNSFNT